MAEARCVRGSGAKVARYSRGGLLESTSASSAFRFPWEEGRPRMMGDGAVLLAADVTGVGEDLWCARFVRTIGDAAGVAAVKDGEGGARESGTRGVVAVYVFDERRRTGARSPGVDFVTLREAVEGDCLTV